MPRMDGLLDVYKTEAITWLVAGTPDQWGTYPAPAETAINARVVWKTRWVRNLAGEQVVSSASLLMTEMPTHEDRFRISGVDHAIVAIVEVKDFSVSHYEVFLA